MASEVSRLKRGKKRPWPEFAPPEALDNPDVRARLSEQIPEGDGFYHDAYRDLLKSAGRLANVGDDAAFIAIAHLVYAWMPTILKRFGTKRSEVVASDWREVAGKIGDVGRTAHKCAAPIEAISFLKELDDESPINGSWVGLSKFLHFICLFYMCP